MIGSSSYRSPDVLPIAGTSCRYRFCRALRTCWTSANTSSAANATEATASGSATDRLAPPNEKALGVMRRWAGSEGLKFEFWSEGALVLE